jgi:hypothetical protein
VARGDAWSRRGSQLSFPMGKPGAPSMSETTKHTSQPHGKRGARRGSASAPKRGFYARSFSDEEVLEIGRLALADLSLDEEIGMLRILMRRVIEADLLPGEAIELFGKATDQLRRLMETKVRLVRQGLSSHAIDEAMDKALDELAEELGITL